MFCKGLVSVATTTGSKYLACTVNLLSRQVSGFFHFGSGLDGS